MQGGEGGRPCTQYMKIDKTTRLLHMLNDYALPGRVPDSVILDGAKNADEGIQQEPYKANSESYAAHHDPAVPDPSTSYMHCMIRQKAWVTG